MENDLKNANGVHGYKVFNPDWTCSPNGNTKQYTCPGKFEEDGELDVWDRGMHFCQTAADCFSYYSFNSNNKVAEVIAYGDVRTEGNKSRTNKLEIVREIPWDEVLRIVNLGKNCTGRCNTGDSNTGDCNTGNWNTGDRNTGDRNAGNCNTGNWNTGDCNAGNWNTGNCNPGNCNPGNRNTGNRNTGDWNTGDRNTGDRNTGNWNTGDRNTGDRNTGIWNTGDRNTGIWNTGNRNTGNWNTGNCNTGDRNTGDWNAGNWNTGDCNTGNCNIGDWNKSSFNTGCFNTEKQTIFLFNKPSGMTYQDWHTSDANRLLHQMPMGVVTWIPLEDMTDVEKAEHPSYETTEGFLKVIEGSERVQLWWNGLSDNDKYIIKSIPNFDPEIFKQCTGIDVKG